MKAKVYLVGAGPGDPELLTLKALRLLRSADVVLHDELVAPEILARIPASAWVYNVGKRCGRKPVNQQEIHALLVAYARKGLSVVRLKGGDPLIFGRGGEEMEALREAGIDFEVVPGVTAALGAAASARVPLTDRRLASKVIFLTGHRTTGKTPAAWSGEASAETTFVVYMPGENCGRLAAELCAAGLGGQTPCVIVSCAATPEEQIERTTLAELPHAARLPAPTLLIIGAVAAAAGSTENSAGDSHTLLSVSAADLAAGLPAGTVP